MEKTAQTPLAIVGMACRLPGADNLDEFWNLLREGRCGLGELPPDRFNRELYYHPKKSLRNKSYTTKGGIVPPRPFDHAACPVSRDLVGKSHHIHLQLLEVAADAFRRAGIDPFGLHDRQVGVYIGHTPPSALAARLVHARQIGHTARFLREIPEFDQLTGGESETVIRELVESFRSEFGPDDPTFTMFANAYHAASCISVGFDLDGPTMSFDAACASSLRALGHAARALQLGQIDTAIVGGASYCHQDTLVLFSQAQSVSPTASRPFDDDADGLVASEGYVILLLKTLEQAIADGDSIAAVIRSISISSDGKGKSLWAPRPEGQIEAIQRAYHSGLSPADLQFIEMHATSTQVGDATEVTAFAEVMREHLPPGRKIPVGSVKANVGHTLETAGVASLVKTVLALQQGVIPPQIGVTKLNDKIDWDSIPFYVPTEPLVWNRPAANTPRRAAVNAFGIGGLNVHMVIEEPLPSPNSVNTISAKPRLDTDESAIAVIGFGAVFPGARTIDALWDVFRGGQDQKSDVPANRWDPAVGYDPNCLDQLYCVPTKRGGFITDFEYDWKKHKVPPKQVASADPLQFMLLDAADQAFHDAGYGELKFDRSRCGVIVGTVFGGEFADQLTMGLRLPEFQQRLATALMQRGVPEEQIDSVQKQYTEILLKRMPALIDETGSFTASTLASRITKTFDLMGGAVAVDAGDASAMAALNAARDLLVTGDCDLMVCAAGQRNMSFAWYDALKSSGLLSHEEPRGPFSAKADGIVPGEGVGVMLLKRLADARRDGDDIRAIIRGIGVGRNKSLSDGISLAMKRSFEQSGLAPETVSVVETGSAGVPDSDQAELTAIQEVYGRTERDAPLMLGAVAGQFGNTGGASGMAEMIKAVGELNDVQMPRTAGIDEPTPEVTDAKGNVQLATESKRLSGINEDGRLIAGVTNYSQFHTAYHVLIEGKQKVPKETKPAGGELTSLPAAESRSVSLPVSGVGDFSPYRVIRFGAADQSGLSTAMTTAHSNCESVWHNAATSAFRADELCRAAIVAQDVDELSQKLKLAVDQFDNFTARLLLAERGVFFGEVKAGHRSAFLFPGQGSQYAGMLKQLVDEFEPAAHAMEAVDEILTKHRLPTFAQLAWDEPDTLGTDIRHTQFSLLAADTIMFAAASAIGLRAERFAGHSFGELAALVAADAWSFEDALLATSARCRAIESCRDSAGVMLSTSAPFEVLNALCKEVGGRLFISHHNAPDQTVAGGDEAEIKRLAQLVESEGFKSKILAVPAAFHTPLMEQTKTPFREGLAEIVLETPCVPLLSSVTNQYVSEPAEIRDNLVVQMTQPVRYADLIERLISEGVSTFIEVGPKQVLTGLHKRITSDPGMAIVSCDHTKRGGLRQLVFARACQEVTGALDPERRRLPIRIASPTSVKSEIVSRASDVVDSIRGSSAESVSEDELNLVRLSGAPFDMGLAHGRAHKHLILKLIRRYADLAGTRWDRLYDMDQLVARAEEFFGPAELEELRGVAKGADVSVGSIVSHNLRLFLDAGSGGIHFAVAGHANPAGGLLHAVNEDLQLGLSVRDVLDRTIQVRRPADGIAHIIFSVPGAVGGLNGINAKGIGVSTTALLDVPKLAGKKPGWLHTTLVKRVLEQAEDINSALDILRNAPKTVGWSICLSDARSDRLSYVEFDGETMRAQVAPRAIIAANHRLLTTFESDPPKSSRSRLERLKELLGGERPKQVDVEQIQRALRDRFDASRGREVSSANLNTIRRVDNQISLVMQPGAGRVWITPGPLANGHQDEFRAIDLNALMPRADQTPSRDESISTPMVISTEALNKAYAVAAAEPTGDVCRRYVLRMVESPRRGAPAQSMTFSGNAVILGHNPTADVLADRLQQDGVPVFRLPDTTNLDELIGALEACWQSGPAPHLFIATARDDAATSLDIDRWNIRREQGVMLPYLVCQRWYQLTAEAALLDRASVAAVTALGGDFGLSGQVANIEGGALAGLLKGIRLELQMSHNNHSFRAKVIDADATASPETIVDELLKELASDDDEIEVGLMQGRRFMLRPVVQSPPEKPSGDLTGGTWVITGGARGVTAVVAMELGRRFGLKLHLIGSSPPPDIPQKYRDLSEEEMKELRGVIMKEAHAAGEKPIDAWARFEKALEIDQTLRSFEAAGVNATYHACDISNRERLGSVLDEIRQVDGPIDGVVHGAGFERACRFDKKQPELVDRTIAAKVDGAAALMALTKDDPVKLFAAFGSVSGRFGGVGQTDYCTANNLLAKLIDWYRRQRPETAATVFHWHAWDDVGMAVRPESKHIRKLHNIQFMPSKEGAAHLVKELLAGLPEPEIVVTELSYCQEKYASAAPSDDAITPSVTSGGADDLPMIDRVASREANRLTAEIDLDPTRDPFLLQHRFKGRPMMPVVMSLETLAQTASLLADEGQQVVSISGIEIVNGLRFHTDDVQTARVHAEREGNSVSCEFTSDFYNRKGKLLLKDKPYLRGVVELASRPVTTEISLPSEPEKWNNVWYPEEDIVIWHGPAFRCLQHTFIDGGDHAWGRLVAPDLNELGGARQGSGWQLPAAILDACFFACGIYLWIKFRGVVAIPDGIGKVMLGRLPQSHEECQVHIHDRGRQENRALYDFDVIGEDGSIVIQVEGYRNVIVAEETADVV